MRALSCRKLGRDALSIGADRQHHARKAEYAADNEHVRGGSSYPYVYVYVVFTRRARLISPVPCRLFVVRMVPNLWSALFRTINGGVLPGRHGFPVSERV